MRIVECAAETGGDRLAKFRAIYYFGAMATPPEPPETEQAPHEIAPTESSRDEIDAFLAQVRTAPASTPAAGPGRLIFAMDATMSRRPTWDMALAVQAEMFNAVQAIGGLGVQLVFFRSFDECRASRWVSDAAALARLMTAVECRGGYTQIRKVLKHALREASAAKVSALVYVGDAMEEAPDELCNLAGQLGLLGMPRPSCSRKATMARRAPASRKSPGSRVAPRAASGRKRPASFASCLRLSRFTPPVDARHFEDYAKGRAGSTLLLEQMSKP